MKEFLAAGNDLEHMSLELHMTGAGTRRLLTTPYKVGDMVTSDKLIGLQLRPGWRLPCQEPKWNEGFRPFEIPRTKPDPPVETFVELDFVMTRGDGGAPTTRNIWRQAVDLSLVKRKNGRVIVEGGSRDSQYLIELSAAKPLGGVVESSSWDRKRVDSYIYLVKSVTSLAMLHRAEMFFIESILPLLKARDEFVSLSTRKDEAVKALKAVAQEMGSALVGYATKRLKLGSTTRPETAPPAPTAETPATTAVAESPAPRPAVTSSHLKRLFEERDYSSIRRANLSDEEKRKRARDEDWRALIPGLVEHGDVELLQELEPFAFPETEEGYIPDYSDLAEDFKFTHALMESTFRKDKIRMLKYIMKSLHLDRDEELEEARILLEMYKTTKLKSPRIENYLVALIRAADLDSEQ